MKYIRTENGIFKVEKEQILCGVKFYDFEQDDCPNRIRAEFVKEADSIEELCDELVIAYKDCYEKRTYLYSRTIQEFKKSRPNYKNKFFTYYGAIWTDKGLIYVAKMNSEGKLCLI